MWDLLRSEIEPLYPALAGGFFITEPPGMPPKSTLLNTPSHTEGMGSPGPTFPHKRALAHPRDWQIEVPMMLSIWVARIYLSAERSLCQGLISVFVLPEFS